jgi:hypothetical protein
MEMDECVSCVGLLLQGSAGQRNRSIACHGCLLQEVAIVSLHYTQHFIMKHMGFRMSKDGIAVS